MEASQSFQSDLLPYEGQVAELCGVVKKGTIHERYAALVIKVESCGRVGSEKYQTNENVLIRLKLTQNVEMESFVYDAVGRYVSIKGEISRPEARRNPGCFDYGLYLKGRKIYALCDVSLFQFKKGTIANRFFHFLSVEKGRFYAAARSKMEEQAFPLIAGILFGEKSYMSEEVLEQFQLNGISHVLAVSGLHVALLYATLLKIFSGKRSLKASLLIALFIFSYAALSNFSVSVMRAFGMILMSIAARHLRRRYDLTTAASAMAVLFLAFNPFQLFDSGMQLSFLAAYSLGVVLPYLDIKLLEVSERFKKEWIITVGKFIGPCFVVQLSMSPLIAFHFLMFCPMGLIMNPPSVALVGLLLPIGLLMFFVSLLLYSPFSWFQGISLILNFLFHSFSNIANFLCNALIELSALGAKTSSPGGSIAPPFGMLILFYFIYFLFFSETRCIAFRCNKRKLFSIIFSCAIFFICVSPKLLGITSTVLPWRYDTPLMTFLDVGQGDSLHIQAGQVNILVDGGGHHYTNIAKKVLMPYLLKNGIDHIDLAFVTHSDIDHSKGIAELSLIMPIRKLVVASPYAEIPSVYADIVCDELIYASAGSVISIDKDKYISVLAPALLSPLNPSNNENSLVMMLHYNGMRTLLTGDIGTVSESGFIEESSCDIVKIAHHGSKHSTSEMFLRASNPSCAIISCGKNNLHGHPSERVIELLQNSGIMTCRIDNYGAICLCEIFDAYFLLRNASKEQSWKVLRRDSR